MWPSKTTLETPAPRISLLFRTVLLLCLFGVISSLWADYSSWDFKQIIANADKKYGKLNIMTRDKINGWDELIQSSEGLSEMEKLKAVNNFFNRQYRFLDDKFNWKENDYWATPIEATVKGAADCEDCRISTLVRLGNCGISAHRQWDNGLAHCGQRALMVGSAPQPCRPAQIGC